MLIKFYNITITEVILMDLAKWEGWLWLIIALMWLLPLVGVGTGAWGAWIAVIALAIVGISKVQK